MDPDWTSMFARSIALFSASRAASGVAFHKTNAGRWCPWLQFATYPQSPSSGPVRCCDVTDLYQAFSQRTGPGRLWISLSALFVAGFGYLPNPKINTRYFTQSQQPKNM